MSILALEFSTNRRSVAVLPRSRDTTSSHNPIEVAAEGLNGSGPFALISQALQQAGVERSGIRTLVVGLGPGSYTGIRMAIAIAIGWRTALPVELLGVPSIDAIASAFLRAQPPETARHGCVVALDAQQNQFYLRRYPALDAWPDVLPEIEIVEAAVLEGLLRQGVPIVSPDVHKLPAGSACYVPLAVEIARLALDPLRIAQREMLTPLYIRPTRFVKAHGAGT